MHLLYKLRQCHESEDSGTHYLLKTFYFASKAQIIRADTLLGS